MSKVVYTPLNKPRSGNKASVQAKRIVSPDGQRVTVHTVNADSRTFSEDLSYVFEKNVARARRMNRSLLGKADRVTSKP